MSLLRTLIRRIPFGRGPSCDEIMEVLQAYLDGEVDAATARAVAKHLGRCGGCNAESGVYDDIRRRLAAQPFDIDPEVHERLLAFGRRLAHDDAH